MMSVSNTNTGNADRSPSPAPFSEACLQSHVQPLDFPETHPPILKKLVRWQPNYLAQDANMFDTLDSLDIQSPGANLHEEAHNPMSPVAMVCMEEMNQQLRRLESKIRKAAKIELAYLNKSKKLREYRRTLTRRHKTMMDDAVQYMQLHNPSAPAPTKVELPPLPAQKPVAAPVAKSPIKKARKKRAPRAK
jgi:hypothetical protein